MTAAITKILLVEDQAQLREVFSLLLKDEGYHIDEAEDGIEALELLNNNNYSLLVTDIFMPNLNGFELSVKCQNNFPSTKIIMLSGGGEKLEAKHKDSIVKYNNEKIEVNMFLRKPCSLVELLSSIEHVLG